MESNGEKKCGRETVRSAFMGALLLAIIFVTAKLFYVPRAWRVVDGAHIEWMLRFSAEDVAAACALGVLTGLLLRLSRSRPRLHRWVWRGGLLIGAAAAIYAVAGVGIYWALRQPLSVRLLKLADQPGSLRDSIAAHTSRWIVLFMVAAPVAYLLGARWRLRVLERRPMRYALVSAAVLWVGAGMILRAQIRSDVWHGRAMKNPHREMLSSLFNEIVLDRRLDVTGPFPPEYQEDFKLAGQRRCKPLAEFAKPPRNVLVFVLESSGARYMSVCGSKYDSTPRLLSEARHAILFDNAYAHIGYTGCELYPIIYSAYPGPPWNFQGSRTLPPGLAQLLKDRGYRTAYFSAADIWWAGMGWMANKAGMDDVFGPDKTGGAETSWGGYDGPMMDQIIRWIDRAPGKPFYALAWTNQTHDPYYLAPGTRGSTFPGTSGAPYPELLNRYLSALRQVDGELGRLLDALRQRGLADDTLVVVTGDHGEGFGDYHDVLGHGSAMFDEVLKVPLMLWNPRLKGRHVSKAGGHVDLNPTLAHILGIDPAPRWQGTSLLGEEHPGRVYLQADRAGIQFGMADGRYKYMLYVTDGFESLYDLREDPLETRDVLSAHAELAKTMRQRICAYLSAEEAYEAKR